MNYLQRGNGPHFPVSPISLAVVWRHLLVCSVTALALCLVPSTGTASSGGVYDLAGCIPATGAAMSGGTFLLVSSVAEPASGVVGTGALFSEQAGFLQDATYSPLPVALSGFVLE